MDGMDNRYLQLAGGDEYRRGGGKKPVMDVNDVGFEPADGAARLPPGYRVKEKKEELDRRISFVIEKQAMGFVSGLLH